MEDSLAKFIKEDHRHLDDFIERFRAAKGKNVEEAVGLFVNFKSEVEKHIKWEEEVLFPKFEEQTGLQHAGPTQVMRNEHRIIRELLGALSDAILHGKTRKDQLEESVIENRLVELLRIHEQKEEEILYPWIDSQLPENQKAGLIAKMNEIFPES